MYVIIAPIQIKAGSKEQFMKEILDDAPRFGKRRTGLLEV